MKRESKQTYPICDRASLLFPQHDALSISHNDHIVANNTISEHIEYFNDIIWRSETQRYRCIKDSNIWELWITYGKETYHHAAPTLGELICNANVAESKYQSLLCSSKNLDNSET